MKKFREASVPQAAILLKVSSNYKLLMSIMSISKFTAMCHTCLIPGVLGCAVLAGLWMDDLSSMNFPVVGRFGCHGWLLGLSVVYFFGLTPRHFLNASK